MPPAEGATERTAQIDPALLSPIDGWVPAEALLDDAPIVFVDGPATPSPLLQEWLRRVPALTVGWGAPDVGCDLWSEERSQALAWIEAAGRHPQVAAAAALLLRRPPASIWDGLVAESATYSVLQAGPDFARWLAGPRPAAGNDTGPRVQLDAAAEGRPVRVTLSRPRRHNALDVQMRDELVATLDELRRQRSAAVILTGQGPSFCSGGDLGQFGTFDDPASAHLVRLQRSVAWCFAELGGRMVVGLHGACLGAGIELPAFAAHVVAADDARIGLPEAGIGLIPGAGGTVSIPRRIGPRRTLDLIVTGHQLDAGQALACGLVDEVVDRDRLDARLEEWAVRLPGARR